MSVSYNLPQQQPSPSSSSSSSSCTITPPGLGPDPSSKIRTSKKRVRIIPPEKRQKVAIACDFCKKKKFKCSGSNPCDSCHKKGTSCTYTIIDKRSLKKERMAKLKEEQKVKEEIEARNYQQTMHSNYQKCSMYNAVPPIQYYQSQRPHIYPTEPGRQVVGGHITPDTTPTSSSDQFTSQNNHYIPKSLKPLLSSPVKQNDLNVLADEKIHEIEEEVEEDNEEVEEGNDGVSNQSGKSSILLIDKSGTFRYMGETSPISLLYETRNIFYQYVGKCKLTEDLRGCPVIDRPTKITIKQVIPLPEEKERDVYISSFEKNINDAFFVFDMEKFYSDIVHPVYHNPRDEDNKEKLILLYFVLAIGSTFHDFENSNPEAKLGCDYFDCGILLTREVIEDSQVWCVQSHYLQFHYYQAILKKSTAWIHLNLAINYAQSLGFHRNFVNEQFSNMNECEYRRKLFRSLYSCDRISSVFIGRPLSINDYDWDDPTRFKSSNYLVSDFNTKCQIELAKVSTIIGKIVANFYQNKIIDLNRTKKLAVEVKLWSKNLDPILQIDHILNPSAIPDNKSQKNSYVLFSTHLLHLYAIMLISRPFFMYEAVATINSDNDQHQVQNKELSKQFCQAATKASILAIKLMNHYINTSFKECKRMECYMIITCCFYSSIIIGISVSNGQEGYEEQELIDLLKTTLYILQHFSTCNKGAERYSEIVVDLLDAVIHRFQMGKPQIKNEIQNNINEFNFINDPNNNLQSLIEFQQLFVPHETVFTTSSSMPYDYGNYDLFFGDKL